MSDIYLQIAETPSVVTLSSPVISGALSSTVTVANTVTVALDSNSLSALENVTVTVGAAVTISNFPATQAVSLASVPTHGVTLASTTVTVSSLPAIYGTVTANLGGGVVTNSYFVNFGAPRLVVGVYDIYGSQFGNNNPFPISGAIRNNGINNDPWVYIPRLTMSHPDLGSVVFDGYYRFDGVNTWGNNNFNYGNVPYLDRGIVGDGYVHRLMVHNESNDVEIEMASSDSPSPDFPTSMSASGGTLVSGSLTFNTEQRESYGVRITSSVTIGNSVTIGSLPALPSGTNRIGVVTIGGGTVTIGAGTAQIGSVTASISGTVPISISSVTVGNFPATQAVSLASLPALAAGTAQIGSVTASISNSVVTFYPMQGTTVTNSNFTSTTASTTLVSAVATREVLTVFNEGAGNLHISAGANCTVTAFQVRLSAGDYWECPAGQLSLAHTAVFATAGTARVTEVS